MPNGDDQRCPTLGEMAIALEDEVDRLQRINRSLTDQLRAAESQIESFKEVFKVMKGEEESK